jgi:hypothetical protein
MPSSASAIRYVALVSASAVVFSACGGSDPVGKSPLKGTIYGTPFEAKRANLKLSTTSLSQVIIYAKDVPCGSDDWSLPSLAVSVRWQAGLIEPDLSSSKENSASFRSTVEGRATAATEGRLEIGDQSTDPKVLRVRAEQTGNKVEGEIRVTVCP